MKVMMMLFKLKLLGYFVQGLENKNYYLIDDNGDMHVGILSIAVSFFS